MRRDGQIRFLGVVANTPDEIRKLSKELSKHGELEFCDEAGYCEYGIHRQLTPLGHSHMKVAASMIPVKPGERIETERGDS